MSHSRQQGIGPSGKSSSFRLGTWSLGVEIGQRPVKGLWPGLYSAWPDLIYLKIESGLGLF